MPQVDIDGANSKVSADKIQGQSGTTVTVPTGHVLTVTDAAGLTVAGSTVLAADNSVTLAKMAGGVDGNIISYDASGDPVAVVTGSSGQVLTSAGAGAPPTFAAAAGGGAWTYISSYTVSSAVATVDFLSSFGSLDVYMVTFNFIVPASDGAILECRVAQGGSAQSGSSYQYGVWGSSDGGTADNYGGRDQDSWRLCNNIGSNTGENLGGKIYFHGVASTSAYKIVRFDSGEFNVNAVYQSHFGGGCFNSATALSGCQFLMSTGNTTSGTFHLYGLSQS